MRERDLGHFVMPDGREVFELGEGDWRVKELRNLDTGEIEGSFVEIIFIPENGRFVDADIYTRMAGWSARKVPPGETPKLNDVYIDISNCEDLDLQRGMISEN